MATLNESNFEEVIAISVDTSKFEKSLEQLETSYKAFLDRLGSSASNVVAVGAFGAMLDELKLVREGMDNLSATGIQSFENISKAALEAFGKIGQASKEVDLTVKETTNAQVEGTQKLSTSLSEVTRNQLIYLEAKLKQLFVEKEAADVVLPSLEKQKALLLQVSDFSGRLNDLTAEGISFSKEQIQAVNDLIRVTQAFVTEKEKGTATYEKELAYLRRVEDMYREIDTVLQGLDDQHTARLEKNAEKQTQSLNSIQTQATKLAESLEKVELFGNLQGQLDLVVQKINTAREEMAQLSAAPTSIRSDRGVSQDIADGQRLNELKANEIKYLQEIQNLTAKINAEDAKHLRTGEELEAAQVAANAAQKARTEAELADSQKKIESAEKLAQSITKTQEKLSVLKLSDKPLEQIKLLKEQIEATTVALKALGDVPISGANIAKLEEQNGLLKQQETLTRQLNSVQKQVDRDNQGFFDKFNGGMLQSIVHLTRFMLLWQVLGEAINGVIAVISYPFTAIRDGVKFIQGLEVEATKLSTAIAPHVTFADGLKENLIISRDVAKELVILFRERALATGIPDETLTKLTEGLLNSSVKESITSMRGLEQAAEGLAVVLSVSGHGLLSIQEQVSTIDDLFKGRLTSSSGAFLKTIGLTADQWNKIVIAGKQHGDLSERLNKIFEPYIEANKELAKTQLSLLAQLDLLKQKLEAIAAKPVFDLINRAVNALSTWLQNNGEAIAKFFADVSNQLIGLTDAIVSIFNLNIVGGPLISGFKIFIGLISAAVLGFTDILITLEGIGKYIDARKTSNRPVDNTKLAPTFQGFGKPYKQNARPNTPDEQKALNDYDAKIALSNAEILRDTVGKLLDQEKHFKDVLSDLAGNKIDTPKITPPSLLDLNFKPNPSQGTDVKTNPLGIDKNNFKNAQAEYTEALNEIKRAQDDLKQSTLDLVATQEISHTEAAKRINAALNSEASAVVEQVLKLIKAADLAKAAIDAIPDAKVSPDQKTIAKDAIERSLQQDVQRANALFQAGKDQVEQLTRQGITEEQSAAKAHIQALLTLYKQYLADRDSLTKQDLADGKITRLQAFNEEVESAKATHDLQLDELNKEILRLSGNQFAQQAYTDKKILLEEQYTTELRRQSLEREAIVNKEFQDRERLSNQFIALQIEQASTQNALDKLLLPVGYYTDRDDKLFDKKLEAIDLTKKQTQAQYSVAVAEGLEPEKLEQIRLALEKLNVERNKLLVQELQSIRSNTPNQTIGDVLIGGAIQRARGSLIQTQQSAQNAYDRFANSNSANGQAGSQAVASELLRLHDALNLANKAVDQFDKQFEILNQTTAQKLGGFIQKFLGGDVLKAFKDIDSQANSDGSPISGIEKGFNKAAVGVAAFTEGLKSILGIIDAVKKGYKEGGILGGIGAGITASKDLISAIPIVGPFIAALGPLFSVIGGLFTAAAKKIGEDIKKSFQATLDNYQNGNATLVATLNAIEAERADAITRLSGKKGGQDQLDQILPEFDKEITALQKQQKDIITTFETQLNLLRLQSDTLANISKQWTDINKQVTDYLNAGGNAANASEFLSRTLENIQKDAQSQLNDANSQAIQDAIQLNDLLKQRTQLIQDNAQKEFDLLNSDSIERKQAGSVSRGAQILALRAQNQEALDNLDDQITKIQDKVTLEGKIFDLAGSTADLRRQDEALSLQAIQTQIQKWTDLKGIISSITQDPTTGLFSGTGIFGGTTNNATVNVTVNVTDTGSGDIGQQVADSVTAELQRQARQSSGYYA